MIGKKRSTYKTCVFRVHNPTSRKQAMMEDALRRNHLAYSKALAAVLPALEEYAALSKRERQRKLAKDVARIVTPIRALANGAKAGIIEDLSQQIESHLDLRHKQQICSPPTARSLDDRPVAWADVLSDFTSSLTREEFALNQARLLAQAKAGVPRPILFLKYRAKDGFLILYNPEKSIYAIWLNLHPQAYSRFANKVSVTGMMDLRSGTHFSFKSCTGALFPVEFGGDYQMAEFIDKARPQSAKLVKVIGSDGNPHYDIHVSFLFEAESIDTATILAVDRGIYNLASVAVLDRNGAVLHRENIDGRSLRHVQRAHERTQRQAQKNARHYTSHARKAMADEAVHFTANRIAELARHHASQVIMEDLRNMTDRGKKRPRSNFNRVMNRSQYAKLVTVLGYKLNVLGLPEIRTVNARGTSQTCPKCGHWSPANRKKSPRQDGDGFDTQRFSCVHCHFEDDADLNAATVIGQKKRWRDGLPAALQKKPLKEIPQEHSFGQFLSVSCRSA